jgi:hypothetical protein
MIGIGIDVLKDKYGYAIQEQMQKNFFRPSSFRTIVIPTQNSL